MFPIRPTLAPTPAPHPDEATAGPSQPRTDPRQSAVDYATRCLGIGKDQYIHWSVEQAMERGPAAIPGFPAAPADVAATRADLAAYAARSWDELAAPYVEEWMAAPDALRRQLDTGQAASQGQASSSPPPQPGAASQQARMLDDWAARQASPSRASSDQESLPASPRAAASGTSQDAPIPPDRRNSVDELVTQTIQTAQRRKNSKTAGKIMRAFTNGLDALNAKPGRSAIPVGAAVELYRSQAGKRVACPKDAIDPKTGEPVSKRTLEQRGQVWDPDAQELVSKGTWIKRQKVWDPATNQLLSRGTIANRKPVQDPQTGEIVYKTTLAKREATRRRQEAAQASTEAGPAPRSDVHQPAPD